MKLKETRLKKKTKLKADTCALLPINNFYGGYIRGLGKEARKFSHQEFCGKLDNITQKQIYGMFYIMKAKKIDKNNIYTYITKLMLIKITVYLALHLHFSTFWAMFLVNLAILILLSP